MMPETYKLSFLAYVFCGSAVLLGLHSLSQNSEYPQLNPELAHHCAKHQKFHPDCPKPHANN